MLAVFARPHQAVLPVMLAVAAMMLAACQAGTTGSAQSLAATAAATTASTTSALSAPSTAPPTTTISAAPAGHGQVVVLDPGHNGGNASHLAQINALVPAGRGMTKACNTTGTSTNAGYTEHAFTWDVATRVRADLAAKGYQVVMTRDSDTGVGPCVDKRAAIGNQAQAAAVVSIHGDGSDKAGAHGFHVEYSSPALNAAQGGPSVKLAATLRDTVRSAGFATANYLGSDGLFGRPDLGGLNLSDRPTALIECGNMRNPGDAAVMSGADGRQRIADAIAAAIMAYLNG